MAIADAFLLGMGITLVALVVAVFLKEVPLAKTWPVPEATAGGMPLERLGSPPAAGSSAGDGPGPDERAADPGRPAQR
jgi:hypothetical protein